MTLPVIQGESHTWVETGIKDEDVPAAIERAHKGLQAMHKGPIRLRIKWERFWYLDGATMTATSIELTVAEALEELSRKEIKP
ncbi:hypothetical protein NKI86_31750 [Mesorhizobium sp. M0320]|uniref:hypothetical protein n=1 Tax=Mesorhizobium sp. M0320 TaxID=2956936 RepID=UPI0033388700